MHVGLAAWTFIGPPIVGKWAAGVFTMIDQFKKGGGTLLSVAPLTGLAVADMHHLYLQQPLGSYLRIAQLQASLLNLLQCRRSFSSLSACQADVLLLCMRIEVKGCSL